MKNYRTKNGPFPERPHYEPHEIERICVEALIKADLLPTEPEPIRIDRFVEKHFGVTVTYEELPDGVLGYTEFGVDGVTSIVVTTAFDDEGGTVAERRIRTTLAHEAGHGLLHMHLFALHQHQSSMFEEGNAQPQVLCRDVQGENAGSSRYDGRWWEWQANQAIGALLLPKRLVRKAVDEYYVPTSGVGLPTLPTESRSDVVSLVSSTFNVNSVVARIRIDQLFGGVENPQSTI